MSGQYPTGFPNPVGGHQGNFATNQLNPMRNPMNMNMPNMGLGQSTMGNVSMQSPSHSSQQQQQQNQTSVNQQQLQQQQQQSSQLSLQTPTVVPNSVPSLISSQNSNVSQTNLGASGSGTTVGTMSVSNPSQNQQQQQQNQQQQPLPQKEFNIVSLCRFGQETVQDILSRFQEVFAALKSVQPPSTMNPMQAASATTEKKVTEQFRTIRLLFKRLRLLFDKCNDQQDLGMEYTHIESLIPLKDEPEHKTEPTFSEEYKKHLQENRDLTETVMMKNKQLREVIDRIRIIIWEINTMLSMRRS